MKASRAYLAGLGTTGVLIACALLLLMVVSAILTFRGWPGEGGVGAAEGVSLDGGPNLIELEPVRLATGVAAAADELAGSDADGDRGGDSPRRPGGAGDRSGRRGVSAAEGAPGASAQGAVPGASALPGGGAGGAGGAPGGVAEVTEGLTQQAGGAVGGVDVRLGQGVGDTGKALGDTVRDVGAGAAPQREGLPKLP